MIKQQQQQQQQQQHKQGEEADGTAQDNDRNDHNNTKTAHGAHVDSDRYGGDGCDSGDDDGDVDPALRYHQLNMEVIGLSQHHHTHPYC